MAGLLRRMFPDHYGLNAYESWIVSVVAARLESNTAERLKQQIGSVNRVHRLTDDKEVNLYRIRDGRPFLPDQLRFPDNRKHALLAAVTLKNSKNSQRL